MNFVKSFTRQKGKGFVTADSDFRHHTTYMLCAPYVGTAV